MIRTFIILSILVVSCKESKKTVFDPYIGKKNVELNLKALKLDSITSDIKVLAGVESLTISKDSSQGWTIYAPLSSLGSSIRNSPPFMQLPDEVGELTSLKSLTLVDLDLISLPNTLSNLKNLDSLSLYMNKLDILKELPKLKSLTNLKYLNILDGFTTKRELKMLKSSLPNVEIPGSSEDDGT